MHSIYIKDRVVLTDQFARPAAQTPGSTDNFTRYFLTPQEQQLHNFLATLSILDQRVRHCN
jgi:hypothetical protein